MEFELLNIKFFIDKTFLFQKSIDGNLVSIKSEQLTSIENSRVRLPWLLNVNFKKNNANLNIYILVRCKVYCIKSLMGT